MGQAHFANEKHSTKSLDRVCKYDYNGKRTLGEHSQHHGLPEITKLCLNSVCVLMCWGLGGRGGC